MLIMTYQDLEKLLEQEAILVFPKFDLEDAYALGTKLYQDGQTEPRPIAVRIILDDLMVYQAFLPGTNEGNNGWMNRKCATVNRTHGSSLRALAERDLFGACEVWENDEAHYALCGGAFPILVQGTEDVEPEFRGIATISGLPHLEDHRRLTQSIAEYLCDVKNLRAELSTNLPEDTTQEAVANASAWELLQLEYYNDPDHMVFLGDLPEEELAALYDFEEE